MYRQAMIDEINSLKAEAIQSGFDWPSQDIKTGTDQELEDFLRELHEFVG